MSRTAQLYRLPQESDPTMALSTDVPSVAVAAKKMTLETVELHVKRSAVDTSSYRGVGSAQGSAAVEGSVSCLLGGRDDVAMPDVLPVATVAWPEPVRQLWSTFKAYSSVGVFSALCRAYVIVDNRLLLWNFATGKEFLCYDDISELIIAVSEPVAVKPDVFQSHVTKVMACATPKAIHLIGVSCVGSDEPRKAELRLLNVGYAVSAPCSMIKFAVDPVASRIFAAGADGNCYEIEYMKESSMYASRMRLVNHSIAFGRSPLLSTIGHAIKHIKQTWTKPQSPLRDIAMESHQRMLFTLAHDNTITMWKLLSHGGLERMVATKHDATSVMRSLHSNCPSQLAPLKSIFPVRSERGHQLIAIAENGDVFRYTCIDAGWSSKSCLEAKERTSMAQFLPANNAAPGVSTSWCSGNCTVCVFSPVAGSSAEVSAEPDILLFSTSPSVILPPFQHARDVVMSCTGPSTGGIVRVDAIGELPVSWLESYCPTSSDIVAQVFTPPKHIIVAHRHGITQFVKLRPVDTLHAILLNPDAARKEALLSRFQASYTVQDYCCMLLQLATGDVNVSQVLDSSWVGALNGQAAGSSAPHPIPEQRLGSMLLQSVTHDVQRTARDVLLRHFAMPSWSELSRGASPYQPFSYLASPNVAASPSISGQRTIAVAMSPLAQATALHLGRVLYPIWDQKATQIPVRALRLCEALLAEMQRLLETCKGDLWPDISCNFSSAVAWESGMRASLRVATSSAAVVAPVSPHEIRGLQTLVVRSCVDIVTDAIQVTRFLRLLDGCGLQLDDVRFCELVSSSDRAQGCGRSVSRQIVADTVRRRELDRVLIKMQQECPRLFTDLDVTEYHARYELERMCASSTAGMTSWSAEQLRDFEVTIAPKAGALWTNGSLMVLCNEMRTKQCEDLAIRLLLHAAAQLQLHGGSVQLSALSGGANHVGLMQSPTPNVLSSSSHHFDPLEAARNAEKTKIMNQVVTLLECVWERSRKVAEKLLGTPSAAGSIWSVERHDAFAHGYLFDWMLTPRDNEAVQSQLEDTLVACGSPFLEQFLQRRAAAGQWAQFYAKFLRGVKRDYRTAVAVLCQIAQSPLSEVAVPDRLKCRLHCWKEAQSCAADGHLAVEAQDIERRVELTQAQASLAKAIRSAIATNDVADAHSSHAHLQLVEGTQLDENSLLSVAEEYVTSGGGEVQLAVMRAFSNVSPSLFMTAIENCFKARNCNVRDVCCSILSRCGRIPGFPIEHVLRYLERSSYEMSQGNPSAGSEAILKIACDAELDLHIIFAHYAELIQRRDLSGWRGFDPLDSRVPDSYLCNTMAEVLKRITFPTSLTARVNQGALIGPLIQSARDILAAVRLRCRGDERELRAMDSAQRIVDQCQSMLR